jgi:catalase
MQYSNLPLRGRSMAQGETSMRKHKLLIAVIMFGLTLAGIVKAEDQPIEQQLVDAMNKVFGTHPGFRANHARASLSKATSRLLPRQPG